MFIFKLNVELSVLVSWALCL